MLRRAGLRDELSPSADAIWRRDIESRSLLELDCVLLGVVQWLETWRVAATNFVLVTVRSNPQAVREQLRRLDLIHYFTEVIVVGHRSDADNIKARAVRELKCDHPLAWIRDTEPDLHSTQEIGARTIEVTAEGCGSPAPRTS